MYLLQLQEKQNKTQNSASIFETRNIYGIEATNIIQIEKMKCILWLLVRFFLYNLVCMCTLHCTLSYNHIKPKRLNHIFEFTDDIQCGQTNAKTKTNGMNKSNNYFIDARKYGEKYQTRSEQGIDKHRKKYRLRKMLETKCHHHNRIDVSFGYIQMAEW